MQERLTSKVQSIAVEKLEQLGLEIHHLVLQRKFRQLLNRLDEFCEVQSAQSEEEKEILTRLVISGYTIVALRRMERSVSDGDAVMIRAIQKYPHLSDFKRIRLEHLQIALNRGKQVAPMVLNEARSMVAEDNCEHHI